MKTWRIIVIVLLTVLMVLLSAYGCDDSEGSRKSTEFSENTDSNSRKPNPFFDNEISSEIKDDISDDVKMVDVFKKIKIEFFGISGDAQAKVMILSDDEFLRECRFDIESNYEIKNGDIITVTIRNVEYLMDEYSTMPYEISKEYSVPLLPQYATATNLPIETFQEFANVFLNEKDDTANNTSFLSFTEPELYGIYFMEKKDNALFASVNQVQIIIYYDKYVDGEFSQTIYLPLIFENLVIDTDGTLDVSYEDGAGTGFFYTNVEKYLTDCGEKYSIEELIPGTGASSSEHIHDWEDATCTSPKTCKTCGMTEGSATEHVYVDGACWMCSAPDPSANKDKEEAKDEIHGDSPVIVIVNGKEHALSSFEEACRIIPLETLETVEKGFAFILKTRGVASEYVSNGDGTYSCDNGRTRTSAQVYNTFRNQWCPDCGKRKGVGTYGTCVKFLIETECSECGEECGKMTCHTCED